MQLRILIPIVAGINKIIRLVGVLVFMKLADPTEFSVWITCSLILQFSVFLQLGVPGPACRECSIAIGKNDESYVNDVMVTTFQIHNIAAFVIIASILLYFDTELSMYVCLYVISSHVASLSLGLSRALFRERKFIASQIAECFLLGAGILFIGDDLALHSLLTLFFLANCISFVVCAPSLLVLVRSTTHFLSNRALAIDLVHKAWPMLIFSIFILTRSSWDVLFVSWTSSEILGYAATQILADAARIGSGLLMMLFVPYIARDFGENEEELTQQMLVKLERFQRALLVITICGAATLSVFGEEVIAVAAPQYIHLTDIILLKSIGLMVAICSMPYLMFLITTRQVKKANIILALTMSVGLFAFVSCYSSLQLHSSLLVGLYISNLACLIACFVGTYMTRAKLH